MASGSLSGFIKWYLSWILYICLGGPLVVFSFTAFWVCFWLGVTKFIFEATLHCIRRSPVWFWKYITGQSLSDIPRDVKGTFEEPRVLWEDPYLASRSPASSPVWPGRKTLTPKSRRTSSTSLRDFELAVSTPADRPRSDSIQSFASNIDGDFGDTGGWAYSHEDDEALWMAKHTRLERPSFSPGLHYTSEATFGRGASTPRWSFTDSMVRTPLSIRPPSNGSIFTSSNTIGKDEKTGSALTGSRSGRASPNAGGSADGYFALSPSHSPSTTNFDFGNGVAPSRRASIHRRMNKSTTSLVSVPEHGVTDER